MTSRGSPSSAAGSPGWPPRTGCGRCSGPPRRSSCWSSVAVSAACCGPSTSPARPTTSGPRRSCGGARRSATLLDELGLAGEVVHPAGAAPSVRAGGVTVPLPPGTLLGVPTSAARLDGVLSPAGAAAAAAERDRAAALDGGRRRGAGCAAARPFRRRAGRPAGRPAARRGLRGPGGRAGSARDAAGRGRGAGRGRSVADRRRGPGHRPTPREFCACARESCIRAHESCACARESRV